MKTTETILVIVVAYLLWAMASRPATVIKEKVVAQPVVVRNNPWWYGRPWGGRGPWYRHGGRGWNRRHRRGLVATDI